MNFKDLKNPPKKYRPAPFWSWNEKLSVEETVNQINEMEKAGIGGYFMHARGGLQTEYMSDEWFQNIKASLEAGGEKGMLSWGYDENGWPSGFGSGAVNGLGVKYQQKYLRYEETDEPVNNEFTIINIEKDGKNLHFYYEVNPFYVDTLDGEVIDEFIKSTHQKYLETLGEDFGKMTGFFTDEPQVSRDGFPWSFILEREYMKAYGEPLAPQLEGLFFETENCCKVRYNYWKLVRDLFAENYMARIYAWCKDNGSKLTGHMVIEEGFYNHVFANGCCMPPYEYMDIPGMDHLGRTHASIQTEMQLSSVANQLGKKQILSETFALCGWNVSFEELRDIYEHQMVHGINYLCQHLEGYTLRGIRKRDYPASLFKHQPWWGEYRTFNDMVSRIGMLVAEGEINYEVLVIHTVESAWLTLEFGVRQTETCDKMLATMTALEQAQIQYHLGDGRIMERYGSVDGDKLKVGTQKYSVVVVPPCTCLSKNTYDLLNQFKANGGTVIFVDQVPSMIDGVETDCFETLAKDCAVVSNTELAATVPNAVKRVNLLGEEADTKPVITLVRDFSDRKMSMYYFFNNSNEYHRVTAEIKGNSVTVFDTLTGEEVPAVYDKQDDVVKVDCELHPKGSKIFFVYSSDDYGSAKADEKELKPLTEELKGEWEIKTENNALTLDYCDVYFDGELYAENLPISDVQEKACEFGRMVKTDVVFKFDVKDDSFKNCKLAVETPEIFDIFVNGTKIEKNIDGFYFDRAFETVDIRKYVTKGLNEIKLSCDFVQSQAVYENMKNSLIFESEKNKLSYDMEIEAVYVVGDFAVFSDADWKYVERRGVVTDGNLTISKQPAVVLDGDIVPQGYPFFAGSVVFKKKINLSKDEIENRSVAFAKRCSSVTSVKINGKDAGSIMWQPYTVDLSGLLKEGENEIEITVTGTLRNLLGPFHLKSGESYAVGPRQFFHFSPIWSRPAWSTGLNADWIDSYCFVEFGMFF